MPTEVKKTLHTDWVEYSIKAVSTIRLVALRLVVMALPQSPVISRGRDITSSALHDKYGLKTPQIPGSLMCQRKRTDRQP